MQHSIGNENSLTIGADDVKEKKKEQLTKRPNKFSRSLNFKVLMSYDRIPEGKSITTTLWATREKKKFNFLETN